MSKGKKRKIKLLRKYRKYDDRLEEQAENRRKLLSKFDKKTQDWITADFAKLGLYQ